MCGNDYIVGTEWAPYPPSPTITGNKKKIILIQYNMGKRINHNRMDQHEEKEPMQEQGGKGDKDHTRLFQQGRDKVVISIKHENIFFLYYSTVSCGHVCLLVLEKKTD